MSLLGVMILEESQRNLLMQREYETKIEQLPKEKIIIKEIGNHEYHYKKSVRIKHMEQLIIWLASFLKLQLKIVENLCKIINFYF